MSGILPQMADDNKSPPGRRVRAGSVDPRGVLGGGWGPRFHPLDSPPAVGGSGGCAALRGEPSPLLRATYRARAEVEVTCITENIVSFNHLAKHKYFANDRFKLWRLSGPPSRRPDFDTSALLDRLHDRREIGIRSALVASDLKQPSYRFNHIGRHAERL